ncbi:MAG: phage scaffolding protein [Defluviitaleaceae bacterium]|nr:phage scaffolding protein [Defluviitaleaceae bacterium]
MERAFLEGLGLEGGAIDKIMGQYGKGVQSLQAKVDGLNEQLGQRDKDLTELKKTAGDNADLKKQLDDLTARNKQSQTDYEAKIKDLTVSSAIKSALAGKTHDPDLTMGLIDRTKLEMDDKGNITKGLDDQLKGLRESKPFLFAQEPPATFKGVTPPTGKDAANGSEYEQARQQIAAMMEGKI